MAIWIERKNHMLKNKHRVITAKSFRLLKSNVLQVSHFIIHGKLFSSNVHGIEDKIRINA
jgi:hypothetical protein